MTTPNEQPKESEPQKERRPAKFLPRIGLRPRRCSGCPK